MTPRDYSREPLRWGILGAGSISGQFAESLGKSATGRLAVVATRSKRDTPPGQFDGAKLVVGYDALLKDPEIEVVYIGLPHPFHAEWSMKAAEAGKHVLCEKPLAMNEAEARKVFEVAHRAGVMVMEGFMYRVQLQTKKLIEVIQSGRIGNPRVVICYFGNRREFDATDRRFANALGGGAIMDIGCYTVSFGRLIAGLSVGRPYAEPTILHAVGSVGPSKTDNDAVALMQFENGFVAVALATLTMPHGSGARIVGTHGTIDISAPWFAQGKKGGVSSIIVRGYQQEDEEITIDEPRWLFSVEADAFAASVSKGSVIWPAPDEGDSLGNMRALDKWRDMLGVKYDADALAR